MSFTISKQERLLALKHCDLILDSFASWPHGYSWSKACVKPLSEVTALFIKIIPIIDESIENPSNRVYWNERLTRLRCHLRLNYEEKFEELLVAIGQCKNRLKPDMKTTLLGFDKPPVIDFSGYIPPITLEQMMSLLMLKTNNVKFLALENTLLSMSEMAVFIDKLGYFPLEPTNYSADTLEYLVNIYEKFPHLPIQDIAQLKPNVCTARIHRLCEKLWIIAVQEMDAVKKDVVEVVGGFTAFKEQELNLTLIKQTSLAKEYRSLLIGKNNAFDEVVIVPSQALNLPEQQIKDLMWKKISVTFFDDTFLINNLDLVLVKQKKPDIDISKTKYADFEWIVRYYFRRQEFSFTDQSLQESGD